MTEPTKKKKKIKFKHRFPKPKILFDLAGFLAAGGMRAYMRTLDYRAVFYDHSVDPIFGIETPRLYVFWHENILMPLHVRGHCNLAMLLSQHGDAEILSKVAYHMGFDCVRGSTGLSGAQAIRQLVECSRRQHLTITPDGPRGPRRQFAQGPIYLASRLQLPLVPMGFGYDRPWRVRSWDRFALPRPFSRARAVIGPPLMLPRKLDRTQLEVCRERVENLMTQLSDEAEAWATAGTRKAGEIPLHPGFAPAPVAAVRRVAA